MANAVPVVDSLVREYLLFRGFTTTLKTLDKDLGQDKEKGFRVERLVEQICAMISSYDLVRLHELWEQINSRVLLNLTQTQSEHANRLEQDLYKLYLANCVHNKRPEKAHEFFELLGVRLHVQESWKEWFSILYLPTPQDHPSFRAYFSKAWQETFLISLHNFLSIAFHHLDVPILLARAVDKGVGEGLSGSNHEVTKALVRLQAPPADIVASAEVMDDFSVIAPSSDLTSPNSSSSKGLKSVFKKFASKTDSLTGKKN